MRFNNCNYITRKNNPTFDSSHIGTTHTQRAEEEFKTEYNRSFSSEERYSIIFLSKLQRGK